MFPDSNVRFRAVMGANSEKYTLIARCFHWFSALVILWAMTSGTLISTFEFPVHIEHLLSEFNVSVTFLFIPIFIGRIFYRLWRRAPASFLPSIRQAALAESAHGLIYFLVLLVLISGVLMMKEDFSVFHWFTVRHLLSDKAWLDFFFQSHIYLSVALGLMVLLHVLAVVKHQLCGINLIKRMI